MQMQGVEDFYPLSPLQQGILFHSLSDPSSRMYFNQTLATLRGDLDADAFRSAWQSIVDRHPILRTFFVWEGVKAPVQVVQKQAVMPFEVEDWRELSPDEQAACLEAEPDVFAAIPGAWGRQGCTKVHLARARPARVLRLLGVAWRRTAPARIAREHEDDVP